MHFQHLSVRPICIILVRCSHDSARMSLEGNTGLPARYHTLFWRWFAFGIPAFIMVLGIVWVMVARPSFL